MMEKLFLIFIFNFIFIIESSYAKELLKMRIKISHNENIIKIRLDDNESSKSLYEQLPFSVKIEDYASIEKIFYPPKKLSIKNSPDGYQAKAGDVTYYAPWGDVAIFYKGFSYADKLIRLGEITEGRDVLKKLEGVEVVVEKDEISN